MIRIFKPLVTVLLSTLILVSASCSKAPDTSAQDITAVTYAADTELGEGSKTAVVEVKNEEQIITFTIHTDADTVGDALLENGLVEGEAGEYGLYIKSVNGIIADYDTDQTYWAFYIDGEYATSGVDTTPVTEGAVYRLERTK